MFRIGPSLVFKAIFNFNWLELVGLGGRHLPVSCMTQTHGVEGKQALTSMKSTLSLERKLDQSKERHTMPILTYLVPYTG